MAISFEFLKKALLASGWVMAVIAIYNIFLCIYVTIIVEKNSDPEYQDFTNAVLIILWISCGVMCAIAVCGVQAARTNNKVLAVLFNIGIILIFLGNISNISRFQGKAFEYIMNILICISFFGMIVITCCFTYHPDNKATNDGYQQANYVRST